MQIPELQRNKRLVCFCKGLFLILNGRQYRHFSFSTSLPAFPWHEALQSVHHQFQSIRVNENVVTMTITMRILRNHLKGVNPRHINLPGQTQHRNIAFVSSNQVSCPKPFTKRRIGRMKHRSCGQRSLSRVTFPAMTSGNRKAGIMSAEHGQQKPSAQSLLGESLRTGFFRFIMLVPFH